MVFSSGVKLMEHYAWHQHVNFAYYEGIKDGSTARARKTATGWLTDYISYYEKGYAAGRYSFLELTEAQQLLIDLKLEVVITASDYHRYQIEIDRLTGAGLSTGPTTGPTTGTAQ